MSSDKVIEAIDAIEHLLKNKTSGSTGLEIKKEIHTYLDQVRETSSDLYVLERVASIQRYSEILFNEQEHEKHKGGAEGIKQRLLADCMKIQRYAR